MPDMLEKSKSAIISWLLEAGLAGGDVGAIFDRFCADLNQAGVRISRATLGISTLHPMVRAFSYAWVSGTEIAATQFEHSDVLSDAWLASPFHHMLTKGEFYLRRRLTGALAQLDFPVLAELKAGGATDWFGVAVDFGFRGDGPIPRRIGLICSFTTDREDGFRDADIAAIRTVLPALALVLKSENSGQIGRSLLATYLGADAAERVFLGQVERGSVLGLNAVLYYADLRSFTSLADKMSTAHLVGMLDDYLGAMTEPIEARGGQVLKFMGDGLLATFGLGRSADEDICRSALDGAIEAQERIGNLNATRMMQAEPILQLDIALHIGEVLYGNVGSSSRLDFTVIGPAVNEAARIESLCKELDRNILLSETFAKAARHCEGRLMSLGRHALRGVSAATELFCLKD